MENDYKQDKITKRWTEYHVNLVSAIMSYKPFGYRLVPIQKIGICACDINITCKINKHILVVKP